MSSNHLETHQAHKNGLYYYLFLYIVGVITTSKALFKEGGGGPGAPPCQVGLTYRWKNKKQSSGPIELDLEAGNLVKIHKNNLIDMSNQGYHFRQVMGRYLFTYPESNYRKNRHVSYFCQFYHQGAWKRQFLKQRKISQIVSKYSIL